MINLKAAKALARVTEGGIEVLIPSCLRGGFLDHFLRGVRTHLAQACRCSSRYN